MLDYGFRQYDPPIARWHVTDALAEWDMSHSPYAYVRNNPVNFSDIIGLYGDYYDGYDDYDDNGGPIWDWIRDLFNGDGFVNGRDGYIGPYENSGGNYSHGNNDEGYYDEDEWEQFERWIEENLQDLDFGEDPMQEIDNGNPSPSGGKGENEWDPASILMNYNAFTLTWQPRHLTGPDAISISISANAEYGGNTGMEEGGLIILRGPEAMDISNLFDMSFGVGLFSGSISIEYTRYYFSGSEDKISKETFHGPRWEGNISGGEGASIGANVLYSKVPGGFVIGAGGSIGIGLGAPVSGNINFGYSAENGAEANEIIKKILGVK